MPKILTAAQIEGFRQRLCDLALEAFARDGLGGITLRGLAAEVGCSRTTPYRYFKNKADIVAAIRQREFARMADTLEAAANRHTNAREQLAALASAYVHFALESPDAYRIMYEVDQQDSHRYPELQAQIERSGDPIKRIVTQAVADATMQGDPAVITRMLWASLHGLISLHLSHLLGAEHDLKELVNVTMQSLGIAIRTPQAATAAPSS